MRNYLLAGTSALALAVTAGAANAMMGYYLSYLATI